MDKVIKLLENECRSVKINLERTEAELNRLSKRIDNLLNDLGDINNAIIYINEIKDKKNESKD